MKFNLPWPPKILNPNARPHWSLKARCARDYRFLCRILTQSQPVEPLLSSQARLPITVIFHPTDKRSRDLDNCLAAFKAGLDGIADGLDINDKRFRITMEFGDPVKGGEVEVSI